MSKKLTLGVKSKQWLKSVHLMAAVIWLGAAISMNMLRMGWAPVRNADLYAVDHAIAVIDNWVLVPAAFASLLTDFVESWTTSRSFFKYRWVTVKWVLTVAIMIFATVFISRWDRNLVAISQVEGLAALQNPVYLQTRWLYTVSGANLIGLLTFMSVISTLKPWTRQDKRSASAKVVGQLASGKAEP